MQDNLKIIIETGKSKDVDKTQRTFDVWAKNGRAELMQREHGKNVSKFLNTVPFDKPFTFLDVGCGNGWVVQKIAKKKNCNRAVGIDKSKNMIRRSKKMSRDRKEDFIHTDIESLSSRRRFDYIFSMESLYYADSVDVALAKIYKLLKPGGQFFCGTDFYAENKATGGWAGKMKIQMHLYSKREWRDRFKKAGFAVRTRHVKDLQNRRRWKREHGTLFITGTKPDTRI